jgi:hypothetical protein
MGVIWFRAERQADQFVELEPGRDPGKPVPHAQDWALQTEDPRSRANFGIERLSADTKLKVFCFGAPTLCQIRGPIVPSIRHIALDHHGDPAPKQKTLAPGPATGHLALPLGGGAGINTNLHATHDLSSC